LIFIKSEGERRLREGAVVIWGAFIVENSWRPSFEVFAWLGVSSSSNWSRTAF